MVLFWEEVVGFFVFDSVPGVDLEDEVVPPEEEDD